MIKRMSETIIIESNRQIAYKQEKAALTNVQERNANVKLPNNKWRTSLDAGIQINAGDEIQIESVMVNTRGSPEETIEFSGVDNVQSETDVIDNKALIRFQKYITNRQQFNCNLPLAESVVQMTDSQKANYGYIDLSTFANFRKSFPYRGIEGMVTTYDSGEDPTTAEVFLGGVFSKAPAPLYDTSPTRMFLGNDNFVGYGNIEQNVGIGVWDFQTTDVELEVATGFNTPSKIGESLTAQLHQRQGVPIDWKEETIDARVYSLKGNKIVSVPNACITDNSYQTVSTATGDIFRARTENKWSAKIAGEVVIAEEGDNYVEQQGDDIYHRNLLCGNPNEYRGVYPWLAGRLTARSGATLNIGNFQTTGLYTGDINIDASDVGNHGLNSVLLDQLDHSYVQTFFTYHDNSGGTATTSPFLGTKTLEHIDLVDIHIDELIVTNNVYNGQNLNNFTIAWTDNEVPYKHLDENNDATPLTQNLTNKFYQPLYYGRANDELSCGAVGAKINLPTTNQFLNNSQTTLTSYQNIDVLNKKALVRESGETRYDDRNYIKCRSRYDPFFDQSKPNAVQFVFPTNTKFQLKDSKGNYYPQTISKARGLAIVPVFYKEADLPNPNLKDIPFCAFVSFIRVDYTDRMPAPMIGEFFGRSPSMYDNLLAKVISTQKTTFDIDSSQPKPVNEYPPGNVETRTRTYQYMPYCMIGADNPTIRFDDTYGRFTISGLHTAVRAGNGVFQSPLDEENTQATEESMCAYSLDSAICGIDGTNGQIVDYRGITQDVVNNPIISTQSGLSIKDIYLYNKRGNVLFDTPLNPRTPVNYEGCLFDKLGFLVEQLIPYIGRSQSNFNRGSYGEFLGTTESFVNKYNTMVSPFTTNAYISGADQISMIVNAKNQIMGNLGGSAPNQSIYINAESDSLVAVNLPSKLDYSYLIVYSNIVQNTQFFGGGSGSQKIPAMAYVTRNYSTGDFFFSGGPTGWTYIADKDYILTEFDTNITLPNGLPAPIENNSSVIFKIIKPKQLPPPLSAFNQQPKKK